MLFPGVSRPLHIFEPRYRAMVADALKGDRIIGMTTLKPGYEANYAGRPPIYEIGCAGVITDVEELPGGRFNIVLRGLVKFRVTGEDDSRAYRLARVDAMPEVLDDAEKAALRKQRQRLEALVTKGSDSKVPPDTTDEELVNMLAQYMPMTHAATAGAARAEECAPTRTSADRSDRVEAGAHRLRAVMQATWPAWLVHAYTATGAVLAFLAMQAATTRNFRAAFLWLFVAVLVDSTDGLLARRVGRP